MRRVTGRRATVLGAGRTDAGVHAEGQIAVFRTDSSIPAERFRGALNAHLPAAVSVLETTEAPEGFHPQHDAVSKRYRYIILNRPSRPARERERCWWVKTPLSVAAMQAAARPLVGRHDFRSFTTEASRRKNTIRTVRVLKLRRQGDRITIEIEGTGFLYNMVRAIVGTLVDVGRGHTKPRAIRAILRARDRSRAGRTGPPGGLCLVEIRYGGRRQKSGAGIQNGF